MLDQSHNKAVLLGDIILTQAAEISMLVCSVILENPVLVLLLPSPLVDVKQDSTVLEAQKLLKKMHAHLAQPV